MKRKIISLGAILILVSNINAQYIPKILPPSPNATSIAKFVESPVSYYRGSARVGIPLFSLTSGDIPLTISIQYDTKGIRVGEIASSVGAGWSLSAGGLITRQVRQRPDEYNKGYLTYSYNADFENNPGLRQQLSSDNAGSASSDTPVDEDPDLFYINFLGKSAKFVIDNVTKKAVLQSFDDWKVDIDYEGINSANYRINRIVITDEFGVKYYFGKDSSDANPAYDVVTSVSSGIIADAPKSEENGYKTAWHLKEIKTQKRSCLFNYASEQVTTYSKSDLNKGDNVGSILLSTTKTTQQMLQNISFFEGALDFIYSTAEREDLEGGRVLNSIILKDGKGTQIKKTAFIQTYRLGNGDHNNIHSVILSKDQKSDKRLFLNQINEIGRETSIISSYKFEYNPMQLPNRHSNSIDHWGYYNGRSNSMNIFMNAQTGNRDVSGNYSQAGILTKVIYPTGGSENFYYEDNAVLIPNYFSSFILANPSTVLYDEKSTALAKAANNFVLNNGSQVLGKYVKEFEIPTVYGNKFFYTATLGPGCTAIETSDCKTKVRLHRFDRNTGSVLMTYNITQGNNTEVINPPLESGNYRLEVSNPGFTLADSENYETNPFSVTLRWKEYKSNEPLNSFIGGGRRISRIETEENGRITKRKFTYTLDNGITSGKLLGIPDYMCVIKKYGNISLVAGQLSNRIQPMSSFNNAGQVGYSQVTESFLSADDSILWSKKYNFSNYSDGGEYYRFPYHLPDDMDWARGLNLKTTSYDSTGKIVETLDNKYHFSGEEMSPYRFYKSYDGSMGTNAPFTELTPAPPAQAPSNYILSHYTKSVPMYKFGKYLNGPSDPSNQSSNVFRTAFFYGGVIHNYQKIKTEYINGLPTQVAYIDTEKGSMSHHQVTSKKATMSDGSITEISYQYAIEQNNSEMITANMIGVPLQTEEKENGKTISKTKTVYAKNTLTNNLILPVSVQKFDKDNTSSAKNSITYNRYDTKGNVLQYTTKESFPTAIIWGYNNTLPIARVEGATYQQIQSFAADIIAKSNDDTDAVKESLLINAMDSFRNQDAFKRFSITTYTYDPLIGVTSVTPSTGVREFYKYDAAGRLQSVVDVNNNILKELQYNYKQ
ncbi:hypothetical protein [Chryseobacterium phocaeense]|uniref:hypothetical protein n=1 Tax=Chryseobacterium phocaeense TaxID=1816690 RepID=UPI0009BA3C0E|nr:hypothetical protein [Chryseobacterium phocaeense]